MCKQSSFCLAMLLVFLQRVSAIICSLYATFRYSDGIGNTDGASHSDWMRQSLPCNTLAPILQARQPGLVL